MNIFRNSIMASAAAVMALAISGPAQAVVTDVDVELQLLIDVSGSVDANEFNQQRQGYVDAFNSLAVQQAITDTDGGNRLGKIAVQAIYWASNQAIAVDWTLLDSVPAIEAFATTLGNAVRASTVVVSTQTGIGNAINFGVTQFANSFNGTSNVIDVSGDGQSNFGASVTAARDAALLAGVDRINGIAIGSAGLLTYYENNVIGGTDSFALLSTGFDTFGDAIAIKLAAEIRGEDPTNPNVIPLPAAGWLMITGLGGLAMLRRRRKAA